MTDYEKEFQNCDSACGEPFKEIVQFFSETIGAELQVLDLGCGQGRDALMAARHGHHVLGVDIAPTGIQQMMSKAEMEGLDIEGEVANICDFKPSMKFDIVILDRVIHMLAGAKDKCRLLKNATDSTLDGGFVLLVDTPKNLSIIESHFSSAKNWENRFCKGGFRFYQKITSAE